MHLSNVKTSVKEGQRKVISEQIREYGRKRRLSNHVEALVVAFHN
jgi:hypothetical protein